MGSTSGTKLIHRNVGHWLNNHHYVSTHAADGGEMLEELSDFTVGMNPDEGLPPARPSPECFEVLLPSIRVFATQNDLGGLRLSERINLLFRQPVSAGDLDVQTVMHREAACVAGSHPTRN